MTLLDLGTVVLLALLDRHHLGGTRLACDPVLRTDGRFTRRTTGAVHHLLHTVIDPGPVRWIAQDDVRDRVFIHRLLALDGLGQVRTDPFALARHQCRGLRQLQRSRLHVALADPQNQGFAREPGLATGGALPLAGRHQAWRLFEHVQ
ncbi:hypothetical protein D3C85_1080780 [compost metagenome]